MRRSPNSVQWYVIYAAVLHAIPRSTSARPPPLPGFGDHHRRRALGHGEHPGPHNDAADFYGIVLVLVVIVVAIALTRVLFRGAAVASPGAEGRRALTMTGLRSDTHGVGGASTRRARLSSTVS